MQLLRLSENICRLRHEKHITQEKLADFIGVTKASVSKWETGQSMPDIMILPQLAAFFDVTIDELMGYEPQLSKEQMQKIYYEIAGRFTTEPFADVMASCRRLIKEYYSCYAFLTQMCGLLLNHFNMAGDSQVDILMEIGDLCTHILVNCNDVDVCYEVKLFKATVDLLLGDADAVIDNMENTISQCHMAVQSESILARAYLMKQDKDKAVYSSQVAIYLYVLSVVANATQYIEVCSDDLSRCNEVIVRIEKLIDIFELKKLHPNVCALFYYQTALMYCINDKKEESLKKLEQYIEEVFLLLTEDEIFLHGDSFFDCIDDWFKSLELGGKAPRDKKLIWDSTEESLKNPVFEILSDMKEYKFLKQKVKEMRENGCN